MNPLTWLIAKIKASRDRYEKERKHKAPFYVTREGGMYAIAEEVLASETVKEQMKHFKVLHDQIMEKQHEDQ